MQNENWGTNDTLSKTAQNYTAPNYTDQNYTAQTQTGYSYNKYHTSFAATLKVVGNIIIYGLPLLFVFSFYPMLKYMMDEAAILVCLVIYALIAFILWVTISYLTFLFDNIAKMAQNTEYIARLLENKKDN